MFPATIPQHYEESALPGFSEFRYLTRGEKAMATMLDFEYVAHCRPLFNAYARRLRVAKSLDTVVFKGLGENTAKGYAALNKHFLMFSAFERYAVDCEGIEFGLYHKALKFVPTTYFKQIWDAFKLVDEGDVIINFLLAQTNSAAQRRSLLDFKRGNNHRNGIYISAMLRNSFVHGKLTANPKGAPDNAVEYLASFMSDFLYQVLLLDFDCRLKEVKLNLEYQQKNSFFKK